MGNLGKPSLLSTQDMTRALVVYSTKTDLLQEVEDKNLKVIATKDSLMTNTPAEVIKKT